VVFGKCTKKLEVIMDIFWGLVSFVVTVFIWEALFGTIDDAFIKSEN